MELKKHYTIEDLLEIMRILRSENGCPWDREQTHESIKKNLIEECYETIDAFDSGDDKAFANELGDVLLQVAFHATIASERNSFNFDDILYELCTKLITRHTHVFGEDKALSGADALETWEKNKKKEKANKTYTDTILDVPHGFPALLRAQKVSKKAAAAGFEWDNVEGVIEKVAEESKELLDAKTQEEREEEFGDLLFTMVNVARHLGIDSETALGKATSKFIDRFSRMESAIIADKKALDELSQAEMDVYWCKIKQNTDKK
ncbi:MAG: nucleoside triphosphate pyrophosphohydrolase [Eubacteriales bacterium]|nr:nucleoside triphosphate pyrophosphohydrolase [Eubacteriales bacterium]